MGLIGDDRVKSLERYIEKVKAIEQEKSEFQKTFYNDGGNDYSPGSGNKSYDNNTAYGNDTTDVSGFKQEIYTGVPSANAWWPTKNLPGECVAQYKRSAQKPLDTISIHLDYYAEHKKIKLPTCTRSQYTATMLKYIEDHCSSYTSIQESPMFSRIDFNKFTMTRYPSYGICHEYLRKDLNIYLGALWDIVHKPLGISKLNINSGYRDVYYNWNNVYGRKDSKSKWGMHIGACAVDIGATGRDRCIIADAAYNMNFGEIYIGKSFVHIDLGPSFRYKDPNSEVPKYIRPGNPGIDAYNK